ncbi:DUF6345 domain-containing protein [Kribbella monticola]|uniref:DUF6345 domain-containing protein n=1 Tax=Kribbella monticola TaxID=2185285 RepID=UPI000DD4B5C6|nr:DUF6345 domain-containing protein [Kribbella monticola]
MTVRVGVAWSTYFQRPLNQRLRYRRLRYAYRAPVLFLQGMLGSGADIEVIDLDENLVGASLGRGSAAQRVDILYVATHGMTTANGFALGLHSADWSLLSGGFGAGGPAIVVFDCCNLVDLTVAQWDDVWRTAQLGPQLRLILGFSTPASVSQQASIRGTAFARELGLQTVTDAWFASIQNTSYVGTDRPISIALGDDDADAQYQLDNLRIGALPGPRTSAVPGVAWRS